MKNSIKSKTINGILWKASERILAQFVTLVVSIVLARILSPDDYSCIAVVNIFFTVADVIIVGGLNISLVQKKDADDLDFSTVFWTCLLLAGAVYALVVMGAPNIASLFEKDILTDVLRVMGLILGINAIKSVCWAYTASTLQFKKFFFSTLGGTVISAFVGIYMACNGFGVWSLVAQQMTNSVIDTMVLFITSKMHIRFRFSWKRFKGLFSFGWKIFVTSFISVVYDELLPLLVGIKYTNVDLAFYNKGQSFPKIMDLTLSDTFAAVLFPMMSKMQDNKEKLLVYTRNFIGTVSFLIFPTMLGFIAISDNFISVVLTDKWMPAAPYLRIFCFVYMFNIIHVGNLQVIKAVGRSDVLLVMEIIKKTSYLVIIGVFLLLGDSPIVLASASIITTVIAIVVNTFPNRKLIGYGYGLQLKDISKTLLSSVIMMVIVLIVGKLQLNRIWLLVLQIIVGIVSYIVINLLVKNRFYFSFKSTIIEMVIKK